VSPREIEPPAAAAVLEAYGLSCGRLEPLLGERLRDLAPGEVLEVRSDRPEAADGIGSWTWLSGHALVAVVPETPPRARYYVRKKNPES
jgi:TusA-related sulfurtransferase